MVKSCLHDSDAECAPRCKRSSDLAIRTGCEEEQLELRRCRAKAACDGSPTPGDDCDLSSLRWRLCVGSYCSDHEHQRACVDAESADG